MPRVILATVVAIASLLAAAAPGRAGTITDTLDAAHWTVSAATAGTTGLSPASDPSTSLTFTYSNNGGAASDSYTIETTAPTTGPVTLDWSSSGFYAYYGVKASLVAFSGTSSQTIYNYGPTNCCSAPSNGFNYSGSVTLAATAGQVLGFTVAGSNGDSNTTIQGTLVISAPTAAAVDEPRALLLLLPGLLGIGLARRRPA